MIKYIKKMPPADKEVSNTLVSEGWKRLKEPSSVGMATLLSLPFMFINGAVFLFFAFNMYLPLKEFLTNKHGWQLSIPIGLSTLVFVAALFVFMMIHELIHALLIPNILKSEKTYWSINGICGFVLTYEKIKKGRFLIISIMPFLILSFLFPFILNILGWMNDYIVFLCLINAVGSCVDCFNMCLVANQVPNGSYIVNNGFETYYRRNLDE